LVDLPRFDHPEAILALAKILIKRLHLHEVRFELEDIIDGESLNLLAQFYCETADVRHTLAAAQTAADHAAELDAAIIAPGHIRAAVNDWRAR
jgi:hypothetical protein